MAETVLAFHPVRRTRTRNIMLNITAPRVVLLLGLALLGDSALTCAAEAQEHPQLRAGERLRVSYYRQSNPPANPIRITGMLAARDADALEVEVAGESAPIRVPVRSIWRLEAHRGAKKQVVRPTLIGGVTGAAALGGLYLVLSLAPAPCFGSCSDDVLSTAELFEFAAAGAVLGATIGAVYGTIAGNPWQRVRLPAVSTASVSRDGRLALAASVPF